MEGTLNIIDYKNNLNNLTENLVNEHIKLENYYTLEKENNNNILHDMSSKNKSLCDEIKEKINILNSFKLEIDSYKYREIEYKLTINNLQSKIKEVNVVENDTNKFDMVRSQAKEISAKDSEIIRLTNELLKLKETINIKKNISMVVKELSPILCESPKQLNKIDLNNDIINLNDKSEESEESEEFTIITYRNKKYYKGNESKVYSILDNEDVGDELGTWVKQDSGKFKLIKI
jgi:hypothetical protein